MIKLAANLEVLGGYMPFEKALDLVKGYGIRYVEIRPQNVNGNNGDYRGCDAKKIKKALDDREMQAVCVSLGDFGHKPDPSICIYPQTLAETVQFAHEIGAGIINHYLCFIENSENAAFEDILPFYQPALKLCEKYNIVLAMENESVDRTHDPQYLYKLMDYFDSEYFKITFDPTNFYSASVEGYPYAYNMLKKYNAYVHLKNGCIFDERLGYHLYSRGWEMTGYNSGKHIYHAYVGEGAVNIHGLINSLKADGYSGYCALEPHTTPDHYEEYISNESRYLRSIGITD